MSQEITRKAPGKKADRLKFLNELAEDFNIPSVKSHAQLSDAELIETAFSCYHPEAVQKLLEKMDDELLKAIDTSTIQEGKVQSKILFQANVPTEFIVSLHRNGQVVTNTTGSNNPNIAALSLSVEYTRPSTFKQALNLILDDDVTGRPPTISSIVSLIDDINDIIDEGDYNMTQCLADLYLVDESIIQSAVDVRLDASMAAGNVAAAGNKTTLNKVINNSIDDLEPVQTYNTVYRCLSQWGRQAPDQYVGQCMTMLIKKAGLAVPKRDQKMVKRCIDKDPKCQVDDANSLITAASI